MGRSAEMPVYDKTNAPPGDAPRGVKRAVLHALILFHLVAVAAWSYSCTDPRMPFNQMLRSRLGRYVWPTGFWQAWDMFAPNPFTANVYLEAEVTLADGSRVTWAFPRADRMGYFKRYREERYRKWGSERVWAGGKPIPNVALAAARYAARQVERPDNPARRVDLVRYQSVIEAPRKRPLPHYRDPPAAWDRRAFYTWTPEGGALIHSSIGAVEAAPPSPGDVLSLSKGTPGEGRGEGRTSVSPQESALTTGAKTLTPTLSRSTGRGGNAVHATTAPADAGGEAP